MEIQLWRELLAPYQLAVEELEVKFNHIIYENRLKGSYSPIERVEGRVKKIASILDKMQKKDININELEEKIEDIAFVGELSLDGNINSIKGILPICMEAKKLGIKKVVLPIENAKEGALINEIEVIGVKNLVEVVSYLNNYIKIYDRIYLWFYY